MSNQRRFWGECVKKNHKCTTVNPKFNPKANNKGRSMVNESNNEIQ